MCSRRRPSGRAGFASHMAAWFPMKRLGRRRVLLTALSAAPQRPGSQRVLAGRRLSDVATAFPTSVCVSEVKGGLIYHTEHVLCSTTG